MTLFEPRICLASCALALATFTAGAAEHAPPVCDGNDGGLTLPEGFCAFVAADRLGSARDLTVAPNGDVYVAVDGEGGGITALRDGDGDGRLELVERFGSGSASGVQYKDDHLYLASDLFILRYPLLGGALVPRARPEVIVTGLLPQRSRRFEVDDDGNLYVDMDAQSDACGTQARTTDAPENGACPEAAANVWRFSADTPNQDAGTQGRRYSTGGSEGIGNSLDTGSGKIYATRRTGAELSAAEPGYVSDLLVYTGKLFPAHYHGGAFVASAGSANAQRYERRHRVDFVPLADGKTAAAPEAFADGFVPADVLRTPADPRDRPLGLAQGPDGSLYISDAEYGRIWRVLYGKAAATRTDRAE
jgi:glucose/arabinose dehydrogenase